VCPDWTSSCLLKLDKDAVAVLGMQEYHGLIVCTNLGLIRERADLLALEIGNGSLDVVDLRAATLMSRRTRVTEHTRTSMQM
jgi:hypothetical protein